MIFNILSYERLDDFTGQSIAEFRFMPQQAGNRKNKIKLQHLWSGILIWSV